jgi:CHAT domain-containing protein/tetratricopeptide (TPR) repeat protein
LTFPLAENTLVTLPELDGKILECHRLLEWSPRSDPNRPTLLFQVATLRISRREFSNQKSDLEKAIIHLTEAVLLPPTQHVVFALFSLAATLLLRFTLFRQPDGVKSSIKCFRFLRSNFHSLEPFGIPHTSGDISSNLFHALAHNLELTPLNMVQDLEEMMALIPKFITADILTYHQRHAIQAFGDVVPETEMFRREDTQQVANRVIQMLRESTLLNPDLVISYALAWYLAARFETAPVMNDCEEAIAILDRIVATYSPGSSLSMMQRNSMVLISVLLVSRPNSFSRPEYLEDAIHRIRTVVSCLPDEDRTQLADIQDSLMQRRFKYFGVTGNSGGTSPNPHLRTHTRISFDIGQVHGVRQESETRSQIEEKLHHLTDVAIAIRHGEITDVEAAVKCSRKSLPLQQSSDHWSSSSELARMFASILFEAYKQTKRSDYLDEAITAHRDLRKMLAPKETGFHMGYVLFLSLVMRFELFRRPQDFEELMQLCPELANDSSWEVFTRFEIPCAWATLARVYLHPSASMAYETAMSLLQETLVFCPTLQTQHLRLAQAFRGGWRLPSDYASYQIEHGQFEQAVETLERGRALIWSEMRGLRTPTDRLRSANPALADRFSDLNQRLESVTMSVAQSDDDEIDRTRTGTEHSIGHLVLTQRRLLGERSSLISHIQSLPGFEQFLKPASFDFLNSAASQGPVIIINQTQFSFSSHIILLLKDSPPSIISAPSSFHNSANQLENELLRVRKEKGLDSKDYDLTLASVLSDLYELVGKPVIERLRELKVPEKSRVWWCLTSAFCSLPLHAMGPIPSADGKPLYFSDLYITSYTPSLSALIESRKCGPLSDASDIVKPSILLVAQPETLPGAFGEITAIQTTKPQVTTLISAMATPETVIKGLREHRFAHFVCHGLLETGKPFDASLELHEANLTLLAIVRSQLPAAEFAFLSACHTAELTEGSVSDEGLHLAAAMQYCGFRSVVGTMWAMADMDGADLSKHFYKTIFSDKVDQNGVPYHERSARALQIAVKKLRKKRGVTLERWVNFVHYGA